MSEAYKFLRFLKIGAIELTEEEFKVATQMRQLIHLVDALPAMVIEMPPRRSNTEGSELSSRESLHAHLQTFSWLDDNSKVHQHIDRRLRIRPSSTRSAQELTWP